MRSGTIFMLVIICILLMSGCATTGALTPLPETLNIVAPNPGIGETAKFSGVLTGIWDNGCLQATTIVPEEITLEKVSAIYAWGRCGREPEGLIRVNGKIVNSSTIVLEWGENERRRVVTLTLAGDKIQAEYKRANGTSNRAILTNVPLSTQKK